MKISNLHIFFAVLGEKIKVIFHKLNTEPYHTEQTVTQQWRKISKETCNRKVN